ncbi:MAG: cytidylate kinase-like family protein [Lachnospiraceae bacterium]|nr:cytidylate kinase-like family protein [Lachnospiraceae bacterium]
MDSYYITIGRQYGSGGKEIGERLASFLGIPFYDKELLKVASAGSGLDEEIFNQHDEKPASSFFYAFSSGASSAGVTGLPINHKVFLAQFDAIRDIAQKGSCVIIGRCADYALEDFENVINIFIYADMEFKKQRALSYGVPENKLEDAIIKTDKKRAGYYNFYSGKKWGEKGSYDLLINSGKLGIEKTAALLAEYVNLRF